MALRTYGLCFLFLTGLFTAEHVRSQTLIINNPTAPPLTTTAGDGLLDIVVSRAFEQVGLTLKLIHVPAERALRNVNAGIDDGDLSRIAGLEKVYPNLVRVPEKLFDMEFVAFSKRGDIRINNWDSLKPYSVGLIRGWKILEQGTQGLPNVIKVRDEDALFTMLDKTRVDVVLYSRWLGLHLAASKNLQGIKVIEPPLVTREMFLYLHKKHRALVPGIANALRDVKQSGLYTDVFNDKVRTVTAR